MFNDAGFAAPPLQPSDGGYPPDILDAIDLMRRFGVPAEIDLASVRRSLLEPLRRARWRRLPQHQWQARLALSELEDELLPPRGWLATLGENVVLLALFVLSTFCVVATLRAPREPAELNRA